MSDHDAVDGAEIIASRAAGPSAIEVHEMIPAALAGERIDRVVALVTGLSRVEATALVIAGEVVVNGVPVTAKAHRLAEGDEIALSWVAGVVEVDLVADPEVSFTVIYEDDDVLVINKPAGLVVHPGAGNAGGTLVHGLLHRYPAIASVGDPVRPGIVHRLDKWTSGLMMVARSEVAYEGLVASLTAREVDRRYLALVWGTFDMTTGLIDAPIGRSMKDPTRMAVSERGRDAMTNYAVRVAFTEPVPLTLVECKLETGRTHQIRVHMQAIGHPVVGDGRYRGDRQSFPLPRMFLHAAQLGFEHPVTGEAMSFESALPPDLQAALDRLSC